MAGGVCKFFLEGRCKFGAQCRFRHPSGEGGSRGGGGNWNNRGGGRRQGEPPDTSRRWDQRGGNQYQLFSDRGGRGGEGGRGGYSGSGNDRRWDDRGQSSWRGGGGGRGRGGWGGGTRTSNYDQSSNYQNQRYQTDNYQSDRFFGQQQNWSSGGQRLFSDNQRSDYRSSYGQQRGGRYGGYDDRQQASQASPPSDPREIAAQIRLDMEEWTKSSMWPLSCYAYFKDTPCLPGFTDVSPEELRWEAYYQAKVSGKFDHYLQTVSKLHEARLKKMHECSNLTRDDVRDMLLDMKSNDVSGAQSGSLFAPTTAAGSTVSSLFGNSAPPSSSLFGSQKLTGSSLFQSPPQATAASAGSSLFSQQAPQPLFGDMTSQQSKQTPTTSSTGLGGHQLGLNSPSQQSSTTQVQATAQSSSDATSADGQLTDKEIEAFKADKFTLGQIPEHAPPDMLCN